MPGAKSALELLFAQQALGSKVRDVRVFERDYRFDPLRKFELDFAWLGDWVGLEIEGGIWTAGAHSRGAGIVRDIEKGNLLTLAGWRLIRATGDMVNDGTAIVLIERLVGTAGSRRLSRPSRPPRPARAQRRRTRSAAT